MTWRDKYLNSVVCGDALALLPELPAGCVHQCVTSPPYWGLRDYKAPAVVWGGAPGCEHVWGAGNIVKVGRNDNDRSFGTRAGAVYDGPPAESVNAGNFCARCGAFRGQLGLEPTPSAYVEHLVAIFREVKRVLRDDGVCWLNLGDSYASGMRSSYDDDRHKYKTARASDKRPPTPPGLKAKDLIGIPWLVAFALRADGWYLRRDVIWAKPNPMPESVTDRPTSAHEYIFLLTKKARYYYDADAVREPQTEGSIERWRAGGQRVAGPKQNNREGKEFWETSGLLPAGRNLRSVWTFATQPYPEAHFATFPLELPLRCIRTSPPKCCKKCGAGWERVTETTGGGPTGNQGTKSENRESEGLRTSDRMGHGSGWRENPSRVIKTLGFRPTCDCYKPGQEVTKPAVILDPFAGSGTVGEAAALLGREYILIEVNPNYKKLIEARTAAITAPLMPEMV